MERNRIIRISFRGCSGVCHVPVHLDVAGRPAKIRCNPDSLT